MSMFAYCMHNLNSSQSFSSHTKRSEFNSIFEIQHPLPETIFVFSNKNLNEYQFLDGEYDVPVYSVHSNIEAKKNQNRFFIVPLILASYKMKTII